eukprot:4369105-Prymnesium_polylepis.1
MCAVRPSVRPSVRPFVRRASPPLPSPPTILPATPPCMRTVGWVARHPTQPTSHIRPNCSALWQP